MTECNVRWYTFSWKKFFIRLQPNHLPLCVLVSFCPTSWFSNVALASSWVEKMKTDLYQLIDAVKQDTFSIVYDPFTTGNMHGYVYQKKKETSHDIQCGKFQGLSATHGKRASQVSSFDTNMKPPRQLLFYQVSFGFWAKKHGHLWQISRQDELRLR